MEGIAEMRLEVTKKTDLALRAIDYLARNGGQSTGPEMCKSIDTTLNYLPQIMKPLVMSEWIEGIPGPGGGYRLRTSLKDVSVLDVISEMEGEMPNDKCVLRGTPCPSQEQCALHTSWVKARSALLAELAATPLNAALAPAPTKGE
jgi:Rrf2 family protein